MSHCCLYWRQHLCQNVMTNGWKLLFSTKTFVKICIAPHKFSWPHSIDRVELKFHKNRLKNTENNYHENHELLFQNRLPHLAIVKINTWCYHKTKTSDTYIYLLDELRPCWSQWRCGNQNERNIKPSNGWHFMVIPRFKVNIPILSEVLLLLARLLQTELKLTDQAVGSDTSCFKVKGFE